MGQLKPGIITIRAGKCPQVTALCQDQQVREFECCDTGGRSQGYAHDDHCAYRMWLLDLFSGLIRHGGWMEQQTRTPDGARPIALQVIRCRECGQHAIRIGGTVFGDSCPTPAHLSCKAHGLVNLNPTPGERLERPDIWDHHRKDKWDVAFTYDATVSQIREVIR